ncbi:MAG: sigma-54-dependent transcriptional regulator, partial [Candidatus Rokuibacteriota bacterium]
KTEEPAMAILDLVLTDGDGIRLLTDLRAAWPGMPALIVTGYVETRSIVEAMRAGVYDYLTKPVDPDVLLSACRSALARRAIPSLAAPRPPLTIVGDSVATARICESVERLGRACPRGILIVGEDGVGKTWLARALHVASGRRMAPCLLHCCVASDHPEVDLLGIVGKAASGLLVAAHGGTLVLDEVAQLQVDVQMRLLQRLEESAQGSPLIIGLTRVATTAPLGAWLGRATITIPPLRDRPSDVLPLARYFLAMSSQALRRTYEGFTTGAEHDLLAHTWPGNVRELKEAVGHAAHEAPGVRIRPEHLPLSMRSTTPLAPGGTGTSGLRPLREIEDAYINHVLASTGGNRSRAARILGVARETLRTRMLTREAAS